MELDDPVSSALSGAHARFAQRRGRVVRYQPDVAPFMAMPPSPSDADWRDAAELVPPGTAAAIIGNGEPAPGSLQVMRSFEVVQMTGEGVVQMMGGGVAGAVDAEAVALGAEDVPEILALIAATNPGPFLDRTIELGDYIGIRRDGDLIAMAGERMRLDGWTEISAICTAPTHRGHGLASRLTAAVIAGIHRRSQLPFLHAASSNTNAIRLYEQLGFRIRTRVALNVVAPAG